jgi:hypothetical protein
MDRFHETEFHKNCLDWYPKFEQKNQFDRFVSEAEFQQGKAGRISNDILALMEFKLIVGFPGDHSKN